MTLLKNHSEKRKKYAEDRQKLYNHCFIACNIHEKIMTPRKPKSQHQSEVFRISLLYACRPDHQLVKLAKQIPWEMFEKRFEELNCPYNVRPWSSGPNNDRSTVAQACPRFVGQGGMVARQSLCAVLLRGDIFSAGVGQTGDGTRENQ